MAKSGVWHGSGSRIMALRRWRRALARSAKWGDGYFSGEWVRGDNLSTSFSVTVPAVTSAASGTVAATWLTNATVTKCEAAVSCSATIQGAGSFPAVVAP